MAGSSLEEATIEEIAEDTAELIADSIDKTSDEDEGASLETTAELDGSTGVTGVGVGRLKMKTRPTITTTATMMIIQVLRFICLLLLEETRPGSFFCVDALPPPVRAASNSHPSLAALSSAGVFASSSSEVAPPSALSTASARATTSIVPVIGNVRASRRWLSEDSP
jgi:hypothetical protein